MNNNTYHKVRKFIEKYHMIEEGDEVFVGLSGGADSVCLLHLLWRLQREVSYQLAVVHVNHMVRAEAAEDAAYARQLCGELDIPFFLKEVDMKGYAAEHKLSREEAGRILRYRAFDEVLSEHFGADCDGGNDSRRGGKIAVAHNANDRAETMLFHLFRGSGMKGICSIQSCRESVIRPILCLDRAEIEAYLKENQLSYCVDATNREDIYTRNKIRHHILPYVEQEICHGAVRHMCDTADVLSETEEYLQEQTRRIYETCVETVGKTPPEAAPESFGDEVPGESSDVSLCIDGTALLREHPVMVKRVLLLCMERVIPHRKDITSQHIAALQDFMQKEGSKELHLPCGVSAYLEYGVVILAKKNTEESLQEKMHAVYKITPPEEITVPGAGEFVFTVFEPELPRSGQDSTSFQQNIPRNRYTKWFDYDKIGGSMVLRTRQQGDYLTVDSSLSTQSVKQYMINEKIPKSQRDSMYLLADDTHVMWIPGYRISERYKVDVNTKHVLQVSIRGGRNGREN